MCVEAVKLPFLAAESCWFGFCLVKLHPKLLIQLKKSSEIFGSRGISAAHAGGSPPSGDQRRGLYHLCRASQPIQTIWGMICLAPSQNQRITEQAVGVCYPWTLGHGKRAMPTTTVVPFVINPGLQDEEAAVLQGQGKTSWRVHKQEIPVSKVVFKIIPPSPNIPEQEILSPY